MRTVGEACNSWAVAQHDWPAREWPRQQGRAAHPGKRAEEVDNNLDVVLVMARAGNHALSVHASKGGGQ
jgi:hypothetical protein